MFSELISHSLDRGFKKEHVYGQRRYTINKFVKIFSTYFLKFAVSYSISLSISHLYKVSNISIYKLLPRFGTIFSFRENQGCIHVLLHQRCQCVRGFTINVRDWAETVCSSGNLGDITLAIDRFPVLVT